jgi:hypothetical protein
MKLLKLCLVTVPLFVATPLFSNDNVTFGDVHTAFNAHNSTGALYFGLSGTSPRVHHTEPDNGFFRGRINPNSQFTEMCENDWSVVNLIIFDSLIDVPHATYQDFVNRIDMVSFIDGNVREMMETPVEIIQFRPLPVWSKNWGYFIEPGSLEPGDHELEWILLLDGEILSIADLLIEVQPSHYPGCS